MAHIEETITSCCFGEYAYIRCPWCGHFHRENRAEMVRRGWHMERSGPLTYCEECTRKLMRALEIK